MREFPQAVTQLVDQVFIDTDFATKESGDIASPLKDGILKPAQIYTLGKIIMGKVTLFDNPTTFFKSVGMALFDLVTANLIYEKALSKNLGTEIDL